MKASLISALLTLILACIFPALCRAEEVVVQWEKTHNGSGNGDETNFDVGVDSSGNVFVIGMSVITSDVPDLYLAKYAAETGGLLWEKRYAGPNWMGKLAVDGADNVIILGSLPGDYGGDFFTAKYSANGVLLWQKRYKGIHHFDQPQALALDGAGNVIVTGYSYALNGDDDIYTAKYAAADGSLIWGHRYDRPEPAVSHDQAFDVAVDSDGNAIVCGVSRPEGGPGLRSLDFYVMKHAAADGALIWNTLSHTPRRIGVGQSVAVDGEGNAIVTGHYRIDGLPHDYSTIKYAAADGQVVWEAIQTEPVLPNPLLEEVRVDSEGNAIVTGYSGSSDSERDIYTAKYAASDGRLLWDQRYNGPGNNWDAAYGLSLDKAGNAIVTGASTGIGGSFDFYTAKYASTGGSLLWDKRHRGASNLGGLAVAVDLHNRTIVTGSIVGAGGNGDLYTAKYVEADSDNDGLPDSWEIEHFGNTTGQSVLDDTDRDGAVELLELAFGTDPRSSSSVPAPAVVMEGGYLTTTITKQPCVRYVVETGAALEGSFSATNTTVLTDTATTLKVRDNVPVGTQSARFLRVQITAAP